MACEPSRQQLVVNDEDVHCIKTHNLTETFVLVDELLQRQVLNDVRFGQSPILVLLVGQSERQLKEEGAVSDSARCVMSQTHGLRISTAKPNDTLSVREGYYR